MAEYAMRALLEKERPGRTRVLSAGMGAADGYPATQYAIEASKMWDLDLTPHGSQMLTPALVDDADLIFAMTPEHHRAVLRLSGNAEDKTFLLKSFPDNTPVGEGVDDPIGQPLEKYNRVFLEIGECLGKYLDAIVQRIDGRTSA